MGFLDNSTVTVDAILTKRGRQILSTGGNFQITKFALSDEEVDYTLFDVTHPNGTNSYGSVIENMNLLEAVPNRLSFNSFLTNSSVSGVKLLIDNLNYTGREANTIVSIKPSTVGGPDESYTFTINNLNILRFEGRTGAKSFTGKMAELVVQSISEPATATVTVTGEVSKLSAVVSVGVKADPGSDTPPDSPENLDTGNGGENGFGSGYTGPR